jgi:hypothetical protein
VNRIFTIVGFGLAFALNAGSFFLFTPTAGIAGNLVFPHSLTVAVVMIGVGTGLGWALSWAWLQRMKGVPARFPTVSVTVLTALLAGRKRAALRDEWRAHLAGESGHDPVTWPKVRQALGFVASATQYRLADAADMAWRPADAVLGSRCLSNLFVLGPVILVLMAIVRHDGRFGLVADDQDPVALGAFLYVVIKTGRWWRGVKLPEPKVRQARSDGGNE